MSAITKYNGVSAYNLRPNAIDTREMNGAYTPSQIVQTDLIYSYDPVNPSSFGGVGTTWSNLKTGADMTLNGGMETSYTQGGYFDLDGVNDYAKSSPFDLTSGDFTLGVWFRQTVFSGIQLLYGHWNISGFKGITIYYNHNVTGLTFRLEDNLGNARVEIMDNSNYSLNTWYYAVYTWNNTTKDSNGYVYDGNGLVASVLNTRTAIDTSVAMTNVYSVAGGDNNFYLSGDLGECHTYNRQLSSAEILRNVENTKARYGY